MPPSKRGSVTGHSRWDKPFSQTREETMKPAVWALVGICLGLFMPAVGGAQSALENPPNGGKVSGISIISGWKCTAGVITFTIDNGPPGRLVHGVSRNDTATACSNDGENGFIAEW